MFLTRAVCAKRRELERQSLTKGDTSPRPSPRPRRRGGGISRVWRGSRFTSSGLRPPSPHRMRRRNLFWGNDFRLLTPALSSFGEEREKMARLEMCTAITSQRVILFPSPRKNGERVRVRGSPHPTCGTFSCQRMFIPDDPLLSNSFPHP